jgi:hypothetical protein
MTLNGNANNNSNQINGSQQTTSTSSNGNEGVNSISKEARNFHKSLRKPPKGIYLNHDELVELGQSDCEKMFDQYDKKIFFLKKQVKKLKKT